MIRPLCAMEPEIAAILASGDGPVKVSWVSPRMGGDSAPGRYGQGVHPPRYVPDYSMAILVLFSAGLTGLRVTSSIPLL